VAEAFSVQFFSRQTLPSIRSKTAMLVLACLLPTLIGFGALSYDSYTRERAKLVRDADRMGRSLLAAVERDLETAETAARALASSPSLASGDLAAFHAQARSILRPELSATAFVVSDSDGKPLLNTRVAYGSALPPNANADTIRKAFARGDAQTSDLARSAPDQPYLASVDVPVWKNGEVAYVLSAQLSPTRMTPLIQDLNLPQGWHAGVLDGRYRIVTRTRDPERWVGSSTNPGLIAALEKSSHGVLDLVTREGLDVLIVFQRSERRGWVVNIGVPHAVANAGLRASMSNLFLSVAALMAIGFLYAWVIGGRIRRSVRALCEPAKALGRGEPVVIPVLRVREAAEVGAALKQVEGQLQAHRTGLEERVRERTKELQNAYALLENVYATAPAGLALLDNDLRIVMINDYLARINAKAPAEHIGFTLPELLGPIGADYERAYRQVRDTGLPLLNVEGHGDVPYDPGVIHHWLCSYHPVYNREHQLVGVSGLVLDVSETKRLTDQLRDISEQFHVLYEMSGDAHMLVSPQDGFVSGNRAAATLYGCAGVEQFMQLSPATTSPEFQPDGRRSSEKAEQFMRYALERGSHQFEWLHQRVDGTLFHADVMLTSLNAGGKSVLQATVRDISERILAEARMQSLNEQLVHAVERAETANRAKSEFLANMSHEIRTPMNAIMGLARLLEESPLARRERSYVAKIKMSTRSLLGILNDVLDFSKIEAGQMRLEYTSFRIDQVLDSISVLLAPNATAQGLELVYDVAPDVPVQLVGDPMRLEQVLLNLVSNAIKFTQHGEVVVSVRRSGQQDEQSMMLVFAVRDTGIGIAPEQHASMFDAFSQADSSTSRKYGGTGLGLTICKRLVGLMGGAISVTSTLGSGATFVFDASFGIHPGAAVTTLPALPGLERRALLVVDDNATVRASVAAQCASFGWRVDSAASGAAALELLREAKGPEKRYDFMLLDAAMPELDGVSVLTYAHADRRIALPRTALMVAVSARDQLEALAIELRLDAALSKPFTRDALVAAIVELHTGRPQLASGQAPGLAGRLEGIYVLLVEDNQINQEVANYLLLHAGAAVDIAADGKLAVDMLAEAPTRYDAVLMDIQMPVMNGYEATRAIRSMGLTDLPIIAMTANVMEDDRARAIDAGMNGHISKPIDVDNLVSALLRVTSGGDVRELRELREVPRGPGQQEAGGSGAAQPVEIPGIDLHSTLPRFGGSFANFVALFKRFEQSQGGTLAEVRALLRVGERDAAAALMHRLRGVAANLGASDFAARALDFEQVLRTAPADQLVARLDVLEGELARLMVAARELKLPEVPPVLHLAAGPGQQGTGGDMRALDDRLVNLLGLLQNNNLKALAEFDAVRAQIAAFATPEQAAALGDAVATLGFANAARLLKEIMDRRTMQ
jgi:PAS domain S-box-containing protein